MLFSLSLSLLLFFSLLQLTHFLLQLFNVFLTLIMSAVPSQETDYSSCNAHNNGDDSINNTIDANNSTQLTLNNIAYPTNTQVSRGMRW